MRDCNENKSFDEHFQQSPPPKKRKLSQIQRDGEKQENNSDNTITNNVKVALLNKMDRLSYLASSSIVSLGDGTEIYDPVSVKNEIKTFCNT